VITITNEVQVSLTPEELAEEFCEMDNHQQARFFNRVFQASQKWNKPFCFQLENIMSSNILTNDGRWVMEQIGIYSNSSKEER
jgi:hypothetical protein